MAPGKPLKLSELSQLAFLVGRSVRCCDKLLHPSMLTRCESLIPGWTPVGTPDVHHTCTFLFPVSQKTPKTTTPAGFEPLVP